MCSPKLYAPLLRGVLFAPFVAVVGLTTVEPSNAQLCSGTNPPCVLTSQYGNLRQSYNGNESVLVAGSNLKNIIKQPSWSPLLVDLVQPNNQINPVYAEPLYVAGISTSLTNCNPSCNMLVVATAGGGVYAFNAGDTSSSGGTGAGLLVS